jgi:hypothetical protein
MYINPKNFQQSITRELDVIKNRVRRLIGSANWAEEGRYKEAVLKNVIRRFLPSNLSVGTGFIVKRDDWDNNQGAVSTQIDIIIYDNTYPVLFSEGDFIVTTEHNIRGVVEVKTRVVNADGQSNSLRKAIKNMNKLSAFAKLSETGQNRVFKGLFSFDYKDDIIHDRVKEILRLSNGMINHISLGKDYFIRHWIDGARLEPPVECASHFYNIYEIRDLSFSYFISNLLHMASNKDMSERSWFSFPIPGTKETERIDTICLQDLRMVGQDHHDRHKFQ